MEAALDGIYLGIDLSDKYTLISAYGLQMPEPRTISTVMGSEDFQIPTFLAKKKGMGQWFFGKEARRKVQTGEAEGVDHLLEKALAAEEVYLDHEKFPVRDLLLLFLKKVIGMTGRIDTDRHIVRIAISMERVSMEAMEMLTAIMMRLGFSADQLTLLDRRESFYYFALSQKPEIFLHDVALFDYTDSDMMSCILHRNTRTVPQVITMEHGNQGKLLENRDRQFERIIDHAFGSTVISAVYLVGDGFDGDWLKTSLQKLCQYRRVFMGKNLYSKGACYGAVVKAKKRDWPFTYIGTNELKLNLYLKVIQHNEMQFHTLITAGESWYESKGECEVILDGTPEIEFWVQQPDSRQAHVEVLELTDLPPRQRRTTRLRITATPKSDRMIQIKIRDLGFGEIVPGSNKTWEHTICLQMSEKIG